MKKTIFITIFMVLYLTMANAQEALKKVYNESIDPMEQIDKALAKAKANNKYVVCAYKKGTTYLKVTLYNGKTARCKVIVQ